MLQKPCTKPRMKKTSSKQKTNTTLHLYYKMLYLIRSNNRTHHVTNKPQKYYQTHLDKNKANPYKKTTEYKSNKNNTY
jgi:hypothetical protein